MHNDQVVTDWTSALEAIVRRRRRRAQREWWLEFAYGLVIAVAVLAFFFVIFSGAGL